MEIGEAMSLSKETTNGVEKGQLSESQCGELVLKMATPDVFVNRKKEEQIKQYKQYKDQIDDAKVELMRSVDAFHALTSSEIEKATKIISKSKDTINKMNDFLFNIKQKLPTDFDVFLTRLERVDKIISNISSISKDKEAVELIGRIFGEKNKNG